ncbi:hypothetical protein HMPREF0208_00298 [Citrobacter koseri]|nr:hypothetical protein HMPREF0208_00298 [Citrobacter koseri]
MKRWLHADETRELYGERLLSQWLLFWLLRKCTNIFFSGATQVSRKSPGKNSACIKWHFKDKCI